MENEKTTIICGVYHEMTEEEKNNFINMMSENGKYDVVFVSFNPFLNTISNIRYM